MNTPPNGSPVSRRAVLGGLAAGVLGGTSGCIRRVQSIAGWQSMRQVTLQIKTLPADADPYALRIARTVADWYRAAGIDARVIPMAHKELLRQVLLKNDFSVFVARAADRIQHPDGLFALLHSRYVDADGWLNPFGFADLDVDAALETQRRTTGQQRRRALYDLQRSVARSQPFSVVAFPDDIRAARSTYFTGWRDTDLRSPYGYLSIDETTRDGGESDTDLASNGQNGSDGSTDTTGRTGASGTTRTTTATTAESDLDREGTTLRVAATDRRATENLNPLVVEYRGSGVVTGLLYDSLGYVDGAGVGKPWLAESWAFFSRTDSPAATVRLRSDLEWHDGESLTAHDVAFTYELLADTSLSTDDPTTGVTTTEQSARIPSARYQDRSDLVAAVDVEDDRTVSFEFVDCSPRVATRAFAVPVLPEHVWEDRTGPASISGIEIGPATEALVTSNIPPVGSGPLEFVRNTPREELVLERFDGHWLGREDLSGDDLPAGVDGAPPFDRMVVTIVGSDSPATQLVTNGEADVTGTPVSASVVPRIGRASDVELLVRRAPAPYVIGYNNRQPPLSNPRFRNTLARIVNQQHVVDEVFDGYARPAVSPLDGTEWLPPDLDWTDANPVTPFIGSEETLDVDAVREVFRNAGYQYEGDRLVRGS